MNSKVSLAGVLLLAVFGASVAGVRCSTAQNTQQAVKSAPHPQQKQQTEQAADEGERVFQQNCSRCHNAPEGFSPRISGTIVRHMRMRANLSRHDEQDLLKYLNP